ncbi:hypothetical protein ETAA8_26450 [Anatilimnocola aggregata]|uniref:Carboxypeptidase regulatory-like domain-containing protein n=1 Tax=Anatilimnocola aggregata TaxID=2528021 RepID=A0A517YBE1_9BACT|nr:hypothetical protein [Anatilimnocola aggregata]QDU27557.1 hypothetical protein ETAA8_26450 [Anatilimnocola aggregata]
MRVPFPVPVCFAWIVVGLLAVAGCSQRTVPVTGQITIKNEPNAAKLAGYGVMFELAEAGPDGKLVSSLGEVDADGKFALSTLGSNDGAYPGKYRVAITPPIPMGDDPHPKPVIHSRYHDLNSSGLEAVIGANGTQFTWELDPPGK